MAQIRIDARGPVLSSRPEDRPFMDQILLQAGAALVPTHTQRLADAVAQGTVEDVALARWNAYSDDQRQIRAVAFLALRMLELLRERQPEAFKLVAHTAAQLLVEHALETHEQQARINDVVEVLTEEEAEDLPPAQGRA